MTKVTNIAAGPRGIYSTTGLVMLEKGESRDIDLVKGEEPGEWFEFDGEAAEPGPLDMNVEDLTAHLATMDDADAVQKLLDAETAGKSRKGAITVLEARRDELLA